MGQLNGFEDDWDVDGNPFPPGYTPDPFAPDPSLWPEPPPWLFPAVMIGTGILVLIVLVLISMWWRSIQVMKAEQAVKPETQWVDLSQLNRRGRWRDEADQPAKPTPDPDPDEDDK